MNRNKPYYLISIKIFFFGTFNLACQSLLPDVNNGQLLMQSLATTSQWLTYYKDLEKPGDVRQCFVLVTVTQLGLVAQ